MYTVSAAGAIADLTANELMTAAKKKTGHYKAEEWSEVTSEYFVNDQLGIQIVVQVRPSSFSPPVLPLPSLRLSVLSVALFVC